ncbi:MAG: protein kinase [Chromatiales bacterium]|nr:protein kinase [Chromatiales bacterium]
MRSLPEKIGKYEIIDEVGRGSMGTVFSAHDPFTNRLVALKVAHAQHIDESEEGQRFRKLFFNEARAAGLLEHPNILRVYDADAEGNLCYLVMEYVHGAQTLERYCRADHLLPVREVVGIVFKVAKALDYAHRQGVIHRDIKPSNLLLTDERDVKLADFSIAMINRADVKDTQFTGFMGSPLYMSPEQINEQPLGSGTDIFSLGAVAYQLLTGVQPFKAESLSAINARITHHDPPPLGEYRGDLPEGLAYAVRRMLRKRPEQRYATGLDLAADLAVIFEDLDAVPSEDSLRERFGTIKNLGFFKGFSDADIWELIRACTWQNYPAGTPVIKDGESDHSFYIVLSGMVGIHKNGTHLDTLGEGDCFGEMGYLSRAKRTATVVAKTDVSLMRVNASTIDRAAQGTQLRFHKVFVRVLIERLRDTTTLLSQANPV